MNGFSPVFGTMRQPVFEGLNCAGIAAKTIAEMVGVSPPTVSKWRCGKARIPQEALVFLTLVLAHLIEDAETLERRFNDIGTRWDGALDEQLATMRRLLHEQEALTATLASDVVHAGARSYRDWLQSTRALPGSDHTTGHRDGPRDFGR